jgi:hypothetical protein
MKAKHHNYKGRSGNVASSNSLKKGFRKAIV